VNDMWEFSDVTIHKAGRDYHCDACEWLRGESFEDLFDECTIEELIEIKAAQKDGWKIKKGQSYARVRGKYDGKFSTFRCRQSIDDICRRLDLYRE